MRLRSLVSALATLGFLAAPLAAAPAPAWQGDGPDRAKQVESYKRYLDRKPFHEFSFDKLVEAAVALNQLPDLVEFYEGRTVLESASLSDRVILSRLYAETERIDEALDALRLIEADEVGLYELIGSLELRRGEPKAAVAALDKAADATEDRKLLERIHSARGQAYLAAGMRVEATAAFKALAELEPDNFHLRIEAASELAEHGLHEEALEEFAVAETLAEEDTPKKCRVMSEIGRLHERLQQNEEALAIYRRAMELMGRGNWLKRDLAERVLTLARRSGMLESLVEQAETDAAANARDLGAREFHARVLQASGDGEGAREVLTAAAADFASDLPLSRRLISVLSSLGDTDAVIAEYQRILVEQPGELDLYLELGKVLASEGRFDAAKRQWNKTLEERLDDPGLCVRLASFYALYDQVEDAVAMYETAIRLEPEELRHYGDLAALLSVRERAEEISPLLERAEIAAAGSAARLEELAGLWSQYEQPARARAAIEAALEIEPDAPKLLTRLADLLAKEGDFAKAGEVLVRVIDGANEVGLRTSAVDKLVRIYRDVEQLAELADQQQAHVDANEKRRAPYLVLAKMYTGRRDPDQAARLYEQLLEFMPDQEDARRALARIYEERGAYDEALAQFGKIVEFVPQTRRRYLKEMAHIQLALLNQDAAFGLYDEILRGSPDNHAAFTEVADAYRTLGMWDKVIECLQQAVRLRPEDGRLRLELADAFRARSEWDRAREHTMEAMNDRDPVVRKKARSGYYILLSEGGLLDAEIATLQRRIEDNPFDIDAPVRLTDLYEREMEYQLALDVLEPLIILQPKEEELLRRRASLYEGMERYDDAIADYETIWKIDGVNRQQLALDLARVALTSGDIERAEKVLAGVHDTRKVARLYEKQEMPEEAIATLQRGAQGGTLRGRTLLQLATLQEDIGDRGGAVGTLEQLLSRQGDSWRVLLRIGTLYHELGRRDEALDIGTRMFAMVRVEEPEENEADPNEDDDGSDPWSSSYRSRSWRTRANQQYSQRLGQLKEFFETKGYVKEFLDLAVAEARVQPSNAALLTGIWWVFEQVEDSESLAYELLETMRDAARETKRVPPTYTLDSWLRYLDSREQNLYSGDSMFAEKRLEEVPEENGTELDFLLRAKLLQALQRDADRRACLEAGCAAHPESYRLLAGLAYVQQSESDYDGAIASYRKLVPMLEASGVREEELRELEISYKRGKNNLHQGFAGHIQRRVQETDLRRLYNLNSSPTTSLSWGPGTRPALDGARMRLVTCLFKLDRKDEAVEALRALEPENPECMARWRQLGDLLFREERFEDSAVYYQRLRDIEAELEVHPILGFNRSWANNMNTPMINLARVLEKQEAYEEAVDLYLTYGQRNAAELILTTNAKFEDGLLRYRTEMDALQQELGSPSDVAPVDPEDPRLRQLRNAGIKLASIHQMQKDWEKVESVYQELATYLPNDFNVQRNVAMLHQRASRIDEAIAVHEVIIQRKRVRNRRALKPRRPTGRELPVVTPPGVTGGDYNITRLGRSYGRAPGLQNVATNYATILKLLLDEDRTSEAVAILRTMARDDAQSFRYMGYSIRQLVDDYSMGQEAVPLLRLVRSYAPNDYELSLEYGRALVKAERYDEAHKIFSAVLNKTTRYRYMRDRAETELDKLEARMGLDKTVSVEELAKEADDQPRNVRARVKLAKRLFKDRRFDDALGEARKAEELAPFRDEIKDLVISCLTVQGQVEELEVALLAKRNRLKPGDDQRFALTVTLANWAYQEGDMERVKELFENAFDVQSGGWADYAPSSWFIEKGMYDEALVRLEAEIDALGGGQWNAEEALQRIEALYLLDGDPSKAFDKAWKRFEKASGKNGKLAFFRQLPAVVLRLPEPSESKELVFKAAEEHGGLRGGLYRAAFYLAIADIEGAEAEINALIDSEPEAEFLYTALIDLARERGDMEAVRSYLAKLGKNVSLSKSRKTYTAIGSLDERRAIQAELAGILYDEGKEDEAWALFESLYSEEDPKDEQRNVMMALYTLYERWDKVEEIQREIIAEEGEHNYGRLTTLANHLREQDKLDDAIPLLEKALILSGRSTNVRNQLISVHRDRGTLSDYFLTLKAEADEDPEDETLQRALMTLANELDEMDVALAAAARVADRPDDAVQMKTFLARRRASMGEHERAHELRRELLEVGESGQRQTAARNIAWSLVEADQLDEAEALIREAYADDDPAAIEGQVAILWDQAEDHERVLACAERVLELSPKDTAAWARKSAALQGLERWEEVLEHCFAALDEPKLDRSWTSYTTPLGPAADRASALAALAADTQRPFRLGAVQYARQARPEAIAALTQALELDPENRIALRMLWRAQSAEGQHDDASATAVRLIERLDREQGVSIGDWQLTNEVDELRHELAKLRFLQGDWEGGLEEWRTPRERFRPTQTYYYSYYNSPLQLVYGYVGYLKQHGLYDKYIELKRLNGWFDPWSSSWDRQDVVEARYRSGQTELATEQAWDLVAKPGQSLVSFGYNRWFWFDPFSTNNVSADWRTLVALWREEGRYDELKTRVAERLERHPGDPTMEGLTRYFMTIDEDWEPLVAVAEKGLEDAPYDKKLLNDLATRYIDAERFANAVPLIERLARLSRSNTSGYSRRVYYSSNSKKTNVAGRIRFGWGGTSTGNSFSSWSSFSSSSGSEEQGHRRSLMALYAKLGDTDRARELETIEMELAEYDRRTPAARARELAAAYGKLDLDEDVVRLYGLGLESDDEDDQNYSLSALMAYFERRENVEKTHEYAALLLTHLDRAVEDGPYTAYPLTRRGSVQLRQLGDPAAAAADAQAALTLNPFDSSAIQLAGFAALAAGDPQTALERFEEGQRLSFALGLHQSANLFYGLGLSMADVRPGEEAQAHLRRALALDPDHRHHQRAEDLLQ